MVFRTFIIRYYYTRVNNFYAHFFRTARFFTRGFLYPQQLHVWLQNKKPGRADYPGFRFGVYHLILMTLSPLTHSDNRNEVTP